MIVFIDESYQQDSSGIWHYALAGFGVNEFRYRALQAAMYQLVRKYFDHRECYAGDEWRQALKDKIIVEQPLDEIELKAEQLLKASSLRRFGGEQSPQYRLVGEILTKVHETRGTTLGVIFSPDHPSSVKDSKEGCPISFQRLIELIGQWMDEEYPGQSVSLVLDTEHNGINLPLSRSISNFLYRSKSAPQMKHIFPSPFWIDSQSMAGAQVADLVAHILMNTLLPETERKPLQSLTSQVFGLSHRWNTKDGGTISRMRKRTTAGGG